MPEALIESPDSRDADSLADWAEALVLLENKEEFSRAEMMRRLGRERSEGGDVEVGLLLNEIEARTRRAPMSYPFTSSGGAIERNIVIDSLLYEFLLWLSFPQSPVRREREYRAIDRYFDRLVLKAMKAKFGSRAQGVRFGTPASDGRPTGFPDAIGWLSQLIKLEEGTEPRNPAKNDAGVDVLVWIPFADGRADFITVLAQCTVREDWEAKAIEIAGTVGAWRGWLDFGRDPLTALAVPFAVSRTHPRAGEIRRTLNLLLDRIRLLELLDDVYAEDKPRLEVWATAVRARMLGESPPAEDLQLKD